ncbi:MULTISPECIES: YnbE family lipoprotein [unclassified Gilliamella]|uniref:YnbE family lipoprotein n=2 Tax=Gilliamella TaxID=1193503 RepID=UPI001C69602F|nr:YnbE family lipoprotein [Gilliamella sp. B3722]MCX8611409.1 YnbE family lipoprotein [Gilliamella sp. B3891]MCX8613760.1 YnbE family lipoprotein [Gilliamella sp. B3773]MCX8615155.1 YnbE family lipoprotein [Gilliamella sp. B3770]MCX8618977.1 YnbE family lipoprotein [Gilliamella sp. B2923]MCX8621038.1 YnbE family lipoprotein [Gilliamella sp. B3892]MCX8623556.1 YnbE family lipoprotein [Gilliamella sp. B3759]MCX8625957.1 YnbE family lipoprotein [Gilliamella sp. B3766]MCX8627450.1 YnbE family 
MLKGVIAIMLGSFILIGCSPTVKVQAPSEPININLNVKIDHEINIKVDKALDNMINKSGLY